MVLDAFQRGQRAVPAGTIRPFFETFRWRIRRTELADRAARNLGISAVNDARIEPEMRRMVEELMRPAFDDPDAAGLPDRAGYQRAFSGVPFVEFF